MIMRDIGGICLLYISAQYLVSFLKILFVNCLYGEKEKQSLEEEDGENDKKKKLALTVYSNTEMKQLGSLVTKSPARPGNSLLVQQHKFYQLPKG